MCKVSVIMCVYNCEKYIREAVLSVLHQTYTDFELIVVNDGSTDRTVEKIEPLLSAPHRLIHRENGGEASARNTGIAAARGEYICFLDADDLFHPEKLEKQVAFMEMRPEYGLSYHDYSFIVSDLHASRWAGWTGAGNNGSGDIFIKQFIQNRIIIITAMVRRECFVQVGNLDPSMNYASDSDLWIRMSARYKIGFLEDILAYYRFHDTNESLDRETCLVHRIASMKKNYLAFKGRLQSHPETAQVVTGLYFRLIKDYVKKGQFNAAFTYLKDYAAFRKNF